MPGIFWASRKNLSRHEPQCLNGCVAYAADQGRPFWLEPIRLLSSRRSKQQWLESTWTVQISAKTDQMTHWSINSQRQWQRTTTCRRVVSSRKWFIHEGWMHLLVTHYFAILTEVINIIKPDSDADHSPNPIDCFFSLGFPSKNYENIFAGLWAIRTTKSTNKPWPK